MSSQIRMQADDFFKAYQVLNKSGAELNSPAIVNLAFALELYIKDLYHALNIKPPRTHNTLKLYKKLPAEVKQEIFAHDSISQNPFMTRGNPLSPKIFSSSYTPYERFIDQIKAISDGFEKWRYSYESTTLHYDLGFALALIKTIKTITDSVRTRSAA